MASFPSATINVRPFEVRVSNEAIDEFKQLLRLSKLGPATVENTTKATPAFGVSRDWVAQTREHWLKTYNWRKIETRINSFENFKATIQAEDGEPLDLHFIAVHSRAPSANAVPIVLLHGWPGSFLEFLDLLDLVRAKYSADELPYTFIVPSLPGYGFSSGPSLQQESTCESMAYAVEALMVGLGFRDGYVAQGGDIGSYVARILGAKASARAVHVNFALMPPPENVTEAIDPIELQGLERAAAFGAQGDAYAREHAQRPATIGLLLSTSPLALLIWIGEKFLDWVDEPLPLDQILDSVSLYWFTETFPRGIYPYRQFLGPSPEALALKYALPETPLGYSWFPKEIAPIPRAWVATTGNLVWFRRHEGGGHFAAMERPRELLGDFVEFVGEVWK